MEIKDRVISIRLVYVVAIIVIIIGIVKVSTQVTQSNEIAAIEQEQMEENKIELASDNLREKNLTNITSRGTEEARQDINNEENQEAELPQDTETVKEEIDVAKENIEQPVTSEENVPELQEESEEETTQQNEEENTAEEDEEEVEEEAESVSIGDVKISVDMDLTERTGLSRDDFIALMEGVRYDTSGFFGENAGTIYDLCEEYDINEIFFCGLISAESGWNIASNHRRTYNYISMMKSGSLIQFDSVEDGLEAAARLLNNKYLTPGGAFYHGSTLNGVQKCFCPSGSWVSLVYGRMKQIL